MDEKPVTKHYPSLLLGPVLGAFVVSCYYFGFWQTMLAIIVIVYIDTLVRWT